MIHARSPAPPAARRGRRPGGTALAALLLLATSLLGPACGRKDLPIPADLAAPRRIASLEGRVVDGGVRLEWKRPRDTRGGDRLEDLGGFLVFRGRVGERAREIARVPVSDRDRFRPAAEFEYVDRDVQAGERYYYRVISYTIDEYYSAPSNQVTIGLAP